MDVAQPDERSILTYVSSLFESLPAVVQAQPQPQQQPTTPSQLTSQPSQPVETQSALPLASAQPQTQTQTVTVQNQQPTTVAPSLIETSRQSEKKKKLAQAAHQEYSTLHTLLARWLNESIKLMTTCHPLSCDYVELKVQRRRRQQLSKSLIC